MSAASLSPVGVHRVFEATPNRYLLRSDPPRFTIVAVNDAFSRATGTMQEAMLDRGLFETFPDNPDGGAVTLRPEACMVRLPASPKVSPL